MQTYNKSIKSDNLQLIYKIIHTTYKKSIKTYNPLQPLTRSLLPILTSCLSTPCHHLRHYHHPHHHHLLHKDYCSHQKIEVGASSELFNNVQRKKREERVFCRLESEETSNFELGTKSIGFVEFYINPM